MGAGQVHGPGGEHGAEGEARDTGGGHHGPAGQGILISTWLIILLFPCADP